MLLMKQTNFWSNLVFSQVIDQNLVNDLREDVDIGSRFANCPNIQILVVDTNVNQLSSCCDNAALYFHKRHL